jgi:hypothetical protein
MFGFTHGGLTPAAPTLSPAYIRRFGSYPADRIASQNSASVERKTVPAAATTFSSIIMLPKSFAPNDKPSVPICKPCVTQLDWIVGTLSKKSRDTAKKRRYSQLLVFG